MAGLEKNYSNIEGLKIRESPSPLFSTTYGPALYDILYNIEDMQNRHIPYSAKNWWGNSDKWSTHKLWQAKFLMNVRVTCLLMLNMGKVQFCHHQTFALYGT